MAKRFNMRKVKAIVFDGDDAIAMSAAEHDEYVRDEAKRLANLRDSVQDTSTSKSEDRRKS